MKTIGLIGGMSWESTITYYQVLNETIKQALGGLHSAKCILYSVDFEEIEKCQANGDWNRSAEILSDAAQSLEKAGADYIVICTNTMHKENRGIHVVIPNEDQVELVNDIIYNELCLGVISNESKQQYLDIIGDLVKSGVQGVILGCTEIGLLVKQDDTDIPLFDTTLIHAKNAALISIDGA
ncbi:MAG: aspartate/glutamate racemase family protein [Veillonella sp.]|uniref:aspartate/glutamate racemase family protein n=1 Tax=Veillonella sp. TaxID=1926307 RepID=UPI0029038ABC|nr:aspartate/glutamate racemase family protein [Veillonella sp.]MDU2904238.1 aspartate/glutamate racemase family protein [Veillonella sp.]